MNIHLRNKLHWAHVFFALYYTPVIHVHTLCYVKIGELRATHPLHVHRSDMPFIYHARIEKGSGPPNLKNSNFLYLHSKIHSNITENMPRNPTPPPFPVNLNIYSIPPGKKNLDPRMIYPPPSSKKIFPDNVVSLTKESYIHI